MWQNCWPHLQNSLLSFSYLGTLPLSFSHFEWSRLMQTKEEAHACCAGAWNLDIVYSISVFLYRTVHFWCGSKNFFFVDLSKFCTRAQRCVGEWSAVSLVPDSCRFNDTMHIPLLFVARLLRRCSEKKKRERRRDGSRDSPSAAFKESKMSLLHIKR